MVGKGETFREQSFYTRQTQSTFEFRSKTIATVYNALAEPIGIVCFHLYKTSAVPTGL